MYPMVLVAVLLLLLLLLLLLWRRWQKWQRFWADRGIPYIPPLPVFGNVLPLACSNASIILKRVYRRYKSPYVGIWYFRQPALVINSPAIARRILVNDFKVFRDRYVRSSEHEVIGNNIIFTLKEPLWSAIRRKADAVFTTPKTMRLYETKQNIVIDLVFRLKKDMMENNHVDLKAVFSDYAADVVGSAITGCAGAGAGALRGVDGALRDLMHQLVEFDRSRKISWIVSFFCPTLKNTFLYRRPDVFPPSATAELRRIYHRVSKERSRCDAEEIEEKDLIDVLRKLEGEAVSEELLVAQCVMFLQAGLDPVANILSYCCYELAYNQSAQDKLHAEVSHVKCKAGQQHLDAAELHALKYLKCVLNETLRKYSQLGWLDRVASRSYRVDEKLTIPAGTPVLINSIGMRYDPALFPEPEKFIPERFLSEDGSMSSSCSSIPFGEGPRGCIGKRLSVLVLRHAVASVVREFKILPLPDTSAPSEATISYSSMFYVPGRPLLVNLERRQR